MSSIFRTGESSDGGKDSCRTVPAPGRAKAGVALRGNRFTPTGQAGGFPRSAGSPPISYRRSTIFFVIRPVPQTNLQK